MAAFLQGIFGHDEARERLHRMLVAARLPAGLLVTGEDGLGKRTLALAFARALLAGNADGVVDPRSPAAKRFDSGNHPDVLVVERDESRRQLGIEQIRELHEAFSLKPVEGARRIAVIVDADRLTEEGGNALLKLLEEPPEGGHLVLTARDEGAVLITLRSRCQHVPLRPLPEAEVAAFLASKAIPEAKRGLAVAFSEGRPGLALRIAAGDVAAELAVPAVSLALGAPDPFGVAEAIAASIKEPKAALEDARERLRPLLRAATVVLRAALRHRLGRTPNLVTLLAADAREQIDAITPARIERRLAAVQTALLDLDRNIGIDLVLEVLLAA